jgi:polar amino acid transport system substrate-binding protein
MARMKRSFGRPRARGAVIALSLALLAWRAPIGASGEERLLPEPLRVAVYDVAPYGSVGPDGLFTGVSVDLWRRVAEDLHRQYELTLVSQMDAILTGLQRGQFDVAIGAITITPERSDRVDFSYPAHRSGVAVAFARKSGPLSALTSYGAALSGMGPLVGIMLALLLLIGILMWRVENNRGHAERAGEAGVRTWHDGLYWAAVTMTTVGYGDKTPKSALGRLMAVLWMLSSLALVSLVSTNLVSRMTAETVAGVPSPRNADLVGLRLAAAADSSGAEYLEHLHLPYTKCVNLRAALQRLADGQADAVVNSVGALQYAIANDFSKTVAPPNGLLAPAYMAFALPANSPLKKPLDDALIRVTENPEWRALEETYFGR